MKVKSSMKQASSEDCTGLQHCIEIESKDWNLVPAMKLIKRTKPVIAMKGMIAHIKNINLT